jgi:Domain of unknown function (DUF1844)
MAPQERGDEQGEQSFTVSDKRLFTKEGLRRDVGEPPETLRASTPPPPPPPRREAPRPQEPRSDPRSGGGPARQEVPAVDFSTFVAMLANNVVMFLGQVPDPVTRQRHRDLSQARHTIDILIMLRDKTQGNLSAEEAQLLDEVLSQLQMAYVTVSRQVG